jgi:uridine phosphorylase
MRKFLVATYLVTTVLAVEMESLLLLVLAVQIGLYALYVEINNVITNDSKGGK